MTTSIVIDGANDVISFGADGAVDLGSSTQRAQVVYTDTIGDGAQALIMAAAQLTFADNIEARFGTGNDADIYYNGTDLVIDPDVAGSGKLQILGGAGVGIAATDGTLHVHTATAGAVTAHASGDDLVIENSAGGGLSILTPNNVTGSIFFGDTDSNIAGQINYSHANVKWQIAVEGTYALEIVGSGGTGILDLVTTGNRIDFDTDNDTSIRCSADDVLTVEIAGTDRASFVTAAVVHANMGPGFEMLAGDLGNNNMGPCLSIGRNTNGTNSGAGVLVMEDKSGTQHFIWVEDTGELRISSTAPLGTTDASAGVRVGAQT